MTALREGAYRWKLQANLISSHRELGQVNTYSTLGTGTIFIDTHTPTIQIEKIITQGKNAAYAETYKKLDALFGLILAYNTYDIAQLDTIRSAYDSFKTEIEKLDPDISQWFDCYFYLTEGLESLSFYDYATSTTTYDNEKLSSMKYSLLFQINAVAVDGIEGPLNHYDTARWETFFSYYLLFSDLSNKESIKPAAAALVTVEGAAPYTGFINDINTLYESINEIGHNEEIQNNIFKKLYNFYGYGAATSLDQIFEVNISSSISKSQYILPYGKITIKSNYSDTMQDFYGEPYFVRVMETEYGGPTTEYFVKESDQYNNKLKSILLLITLRGTK